METTETELFELIVLAARLFCEEETHALGSQYTYLDPLIQKWRSTPHPFRTVATQILYQTWYLDPNLKSSRVPLSQIPDGAVDFKEDDTFRDMRWHQLSLTRPTIGMNYLIITKETPPEQVVFDFNSDWSTWLKEDGRLERLHDSIDEEDFYYVEDLLGFEEQEHLTSVLAYWDIEEKFPILD